MSPSMPSDPEKDAVDPATTAANVTVDQLRLVEESSSILEKTASVSPLDLPLPSSDRLAASLTEQAFDLNAQTCSLLSRQQLPQDPDSKSSSNTVLYLAYGSNLCYQTFQGMRGIRPLSATNVVVPDLELTFSLPGIPYAEPCFGNTRYRSQPEPPSSNKEKNRDTRHTAEKSYKNPSWAKGLVGVVYEVTLSDYAHIIATEGGGNAYADIVIPCYSLARGTTVSVPANPDFCDPPLPYFKAHTLYCPGITADGRVITRPDPDFAQPSLRYLNLLRTGAEENRIPQEYQDYLRALHPYTITTRRQTLGALMFDRFWRPIMMAVLGMNKKYADDRGRAPRWLRLLIGAITSTLWGSYDGGFKRLFGDGERTIEDGGQAGVMS